MTLRCKDVLLRDQQLNETITPVYISEEITGNTTPIRVEEQQPKPMKDRVKQVKAQVSLSAAHPIGPDELRQRCAVAQQWPTAKLRSGRR